MAEKKKTSSLTPKQERFIAEYITNGNNASAAARKAYPNMTPESASTQGWQNLQKLAISKAIKEEYARQGITLEKAIRPVAKALEAKDREGNDDLDKQMRAHDRFMKDITMGEESGVQLNIGEAKGIEIKFINAAEEK